MPYPKGSRPAEFASKTSHTHIMLDEQVKNFLNNCKFQKIASKDILKETDTIKAQKVNNNPLKTVLSVDGSFGDAIAQENFPSTIFSYFLYGMNSIDMDLLTQLNDMTFLEPKDVSQLNNGEYYSLMLPGQNIIVEGYDDLKDSIRGTIFHHFLGNSNNNSLIETLEWFIFEKYSTKPLNEYNLAHCPSCGANDIKLNSEDMVNYKFKCPNCGEDIYLTDVFGLDVFINEYHSGEIKSFASSILEQFLIIKKLKEMVENDPEALNYSLFIKDGPLAFFNQTNLMTKPMKNLTDYLLSNYNLYLVGCEKTGPFVDYAKVISEELENNSIVLLNNDFIYNYIIFGKKADDGYGKKTYYGSKIIFKSEYGKIYVLTIPTMNGNIFKPQKEDYINLDIILDALNQLRSEQYDDALLPIVLVNKNVSISKNFGGGLLSNLTKSMLK